MVNALFLPKSLKQAISSREEERWKSAIEEYFINMITDETLTLLYVLFVNTVTTATTMYIIYTIYASPVCLIENLAHY